MNYRTATQYHTTLHRTPSLPKRARESHPTRRHLRALSRSRSIIPSHKRAAISPLRTLYPPPTLRSSPVRTQGSCNKKRRGLFTSQLTGMVTCWHLHVRKEGEQNGGGRFYAIAMWLCNLLRMRKKRSAFELQTSSSLAQSSITPELFVSSLLPDTLLIGCSTGNALTQTSSNESL